MAVQLIGHLVLNIDATSRSCLDLCEQNFEMFVVLLYSVQSHLVLCKLFSKLAKDATFKTIFNLVSSQRL